MIDVFTERKNKGLPKAGKKEYKEFKEHNDKGTTSGGGGSLRVGTSERLRSVMVSPVVRGGGLVGNVTTFWSGYLSS